jgi:hypothetical protein
MAFLESGVIATVFGLSPTDTSASNSRVIASRSVIESLSGLTATTKFPSREVAINEEACDSISTVCSLAELTDSLVFDGDATVGTIVDSVAPKVGSVAGLTDSLAFDGDATV